MMQHATDEQVALYLEEHEPSLQAEIISAIEAGRLQQAAGEMLDIKVVGLASIGPDVSPALALATIQSLTVLGALHASPAVKAALREWKEQFLTLPLHRQVIPWAVRATVTAVHRPDNVVEALWTRVD